VSASAASKDRGIEGSSGLRRAIRALVMIVGWFLAILVTLLVSLWLVGRIASDRWYWSQWLLWIPTPAALMAAMVGVIAAMRPSRKPKARRHRLARWTLAGIAMLAYFLTIEHRFLHGAADAKVDAKTLTVLHWNMAPPTNDHFFVGIDDVIQVNADITVITSPGGWRPEEPIKSWLGPNGHQLQTGQLLLLTRLPVIRHRLLVANEGIWIVLAEIDTTEQLGRPLVMYMVDLPSNPKVPRMNLARRARELLAQADKFGRAAAPAAPESSGSAQLPRLPEPDLVVGDVNLTRDSASLKTLFPGMRHAYHEAGHGYGATFHRTFPLYHIDQMLLGDDFECVRYDLRPTPVGRHRAQVGWIKPSK
jgi:hypothetical protein